jgi:Helicase conserved C-terminal domain
MSFDAEPILCGLKPFQRATVEYVCKRFFDEQDPARRFLVADEVGLGKTMVARGVIAKLIERHMQEEGRRIDIVYVCSNQAIAQQNFAKLAVVGRAQRAVTDRITTLPLHVRGLNQPLPELGRGINIVPITPTTSLNLRSNVGRADERALLWRLLTHDDLLGKPTMRRKGARRLFMPPTQVKGNWAAELRAIGRERIDADLWGKFIARVRGTELLAEVAELIDAFGQDKRRPRVEPWRRRRIALISELRRTLADACVAALEPDLVILDEFQRFTDLLKPDSPAGDLARKLFDYDDCRSLLLSATPYRMYSRVQELDDDHHRDFMETTRFLLDDPARADRLERLMGDYRVALRAAVEGVDGDVVEARDAVRTELLRVMCRTERLGAAPDRNGMLDVAPANRLVPILRPADLRGFADLERIASELQARDVVEFWKSAPYPLNLMDDYALTRSFEQRAEVDPLPVATRIDATVARSYGQLDPGNARLRGLIARLDREGAWKCLWLPPSLPYYTPGRPFSEVGLTTKRLIFSRWKVVPKAIAALTSFDMDRRIYAAAGKQVENTRDGRESLGRPLQPRSDGKGTELLLTLPGRELARLTDPLALARERDGGARPADRRALLVAAERRVRTALAQLDLPRGSGHPDHAWYAVALLRLDARAHPGSVASWLTADAFGDSETAWGRQVERLHAALESDEALGAVPRDLPAVLAYVGVAGPGPCALRALRRSYPGAEWPAIERAALRLGNALRQLLNLPESVGVVRRFATRHARIQTSDEEVYWRAALDYCLAGNLQAVLDEYVHVLKDWVGGERLDAAVDTAVEALGINAVSLPARNVGADGRIEDEGLTFHSRFAARLDKGQGEDEQTVQRVDTVRKAFNSPFWPFVLATTSIGQEGLDFHLYAHAVVHWNLPNNPVDLEQREGRVHRFKNHAVRRNLAEAHRDDGIGAAPGDPWGAMFDAAPKDGGGLRPYWVFPGPARIERHVPAEPLSVDHHRLSELVTLMGIYRLAFGQPRQDELVAALSGLGVDAESAARLTIDLAPPTP